MVLATLTAVRVCWLALPVFSAREIHEPSAPAPDAAAMLDRVEVADRAWTLLSDASFEDQAASFLATQELVPIRAERLVLGAPAAAEITRRLAAFERKQAAPLSTAADRPGDLSTNARNLTKPAKPAMAPVSEDFLTTTSPAWDPARVVGKLPRLPGARARIALRAVGAGAAHFAGATRTGPW